jgi:NAD(P)H-hydrate epimerase
MMKFVSVAEMIAVEKEADQSGLSYARMMENAGSGLAKVIHDRYNYLMPGPVLGLVGSGNNGGDTLVALDYLSKWGWQGRAYIVRPRPADDPLMSRLIATGGQIIDGETDPKREELANQLVDCALLLDGVLGTGIKLPLRGTIAEVLGFSGGMIKRMEQPPTVIAVDCPSGVDCDSGEVAEECLPADLTVTMAAIKKGLLSFPAYTYLGDLHLVGIGLDENMPVWKDVNRWVVDEDYVQDNLPTRKLDAHKGTFGTALVIAGSKNYPGAALLAGQAAYRAGAGLVTLAVPETIFPALAGNFIEATWLPLAHEDGSISQKSSRSILMNLAKATAVLVGPGFGLAETTARFISDLVDGLQRIDESGGKAGEAGSINSRKQPAFVFDADGLKLLARIPDWHVRLPALSVLTPHPGEMAVLTGVPVVEIQSDRIGIAEAYAKRWGHVVILKGAFTVIASPDGRTAMIPIATPALARAGSGDVLAGLVVGLRAQGVSPYLAAALGAWIHARAGLRAAAVLGSTAAVIAGDILQGVVDVLAEVSAKG